MEVYILDSSYRRTTVVDRFESFIWTERWSDVGDFELLLSSTPVNRSIFVPNALLGINQSKRVMVVETIEDNTDAEGRTRLKIKGRSLEKILEDRVARSGNYNLEDDPAWNFIGDPVSAVLNMFAFSCIVGSVDRADIIPLVLDGTSYPTETIPIPTSNDGWLQKPASLLSAIRDLCSSYDLGFRLYRNGDAGNLFFDVYTGNLRTTQQTAVPAVIFTPELETLQNTTRLMTVEKAKNVAYVLNEQGFVKVYLNSADPPPTGMDRRVLLVEPPKLTYESVDNVEVLPTPAEITAYLIQAGKEELAKNRPLLAFDGEINQRSPYRYGVHYELGDIVEMRDGDGTGNNMRVTEQIFVHDGEGERSYPTLTVDSFIVPGAWDSWLGNRQWADFGATEYWNTQP